MSVKPSPIDIWALGSDTGAREPLDKQNLGARRLQAGVAAQTQDGLEVVGSTLDRLRQTSEVVGSAMDGWRSSAPH